MKTLIRDAVISIITLLILTFGFQNHNPTQQFVSEPSSHRTLAWLQLPVQKVLAFSGTHMRKAREAEIMFGTPVANMAPSCFDGAVNAVVPYASNRIVIGGTFTRAGRCLGSGLPLDTTSGTVVAGFNRSNMRVRGTVNASIPDGAGGWYIAGDFTHVGETVRNSVARIGSDGTLDLSFLSNVPINGSVSSLALSAGVLYMGGAFTASPKYGAALNTTTAFASPAPSENLYGSFNGDVNAVILDGAGGWYVGGDFTFYQGKPVNYLVHINADGTLDTGFLPNPDEPVSALYLDGSTLYLGGDFTQVSGVNRAGAAAVSVSTGIATAFDGKTSAVQAIAKMGTDIVIGGAFTAVESEAAGTRGTAIDMTSGLPDANHAKVNGAINAVASDGSGGWYIGGSFTKVGGVTHKYVAHLDSSGNVSDWEPNAGGNVSTLAVSGSIVYVGGSFTTIGGQTRNRIAALDTSTGFATAWDPNAGSNVSALAVSGSIVYAAGTFTTIGGQTRNRVAALDTSTGLATAWNPNANNQVGDLTVSGSTVYIGGSFANIGGQTRNFFAAVDAGTGLATAWDSKNASAGGRFAVSGSTVYVGGSFANIGAQARSYIAALDASSGLATAWNPSASGAVTDLRLNGSVLYAGGIFTTIGGQTRNRLAAWDVNTGLLNGWNPNANNSVNALAVNGTTVYVGGSFNSIGQEARGGICAINANTGLDIW